MKQILVLFLIVGCSFNVDIFGCSIVSIKSESSVFIGRNFDWYEDGGEICFFKGSSSYAHFTIHQYGKTMPYEGVNEFGLFIGQTLINSIRAEASFSLLRKSTTSLGIMKKVLERSGNVEEAIEVFNEYNLLFGNFLGFPMIHYLVADRNGDSAVIEFVDGSLNVIRKKQKSYQLLTNFLLSEFPQENALKQKVFYRYRLAIPFLETNEEHGIQSLRKLVKMISQPKLEALGVKMIFDEDRKYSFDEIQNVYLINQAMPPEIMDPFSKSKTYTPDEIKNTILDHFRKNHIVKSYTIWSALYSVKADDINIELFYISDWSNPKRFDFKEKIKDLKKQSKCTDLTDLF